MFKCDTKDSIASVDALGEYLLASKFRVLCWGGAATRKQLSSVGCTTSCIGLWLASLEVLLQGMRYLLRGVDGVPSPAVERPEPFAIQVALQRTLDNPEPGWVCTSPSQRPTDNVKEYFLTNKLAYRWNVQPPRSCSMARVNKECALWHRSCCLALLRIMDTVCVLSLKRG